MLVFIMDQFFLNGDILSVICWHIKSYPETSLGVFDKVTFFVIDI